MDLSVIVPARNEEHFLRSQLDALVSQHWSGEWEVVVVDNGSTDGTATIAREYVDREPRVRLVSAPDLADWSHALNVGIRSSDAPLMAFCDADDVVSANWLSAMAQALAEHHVVTGSLEVSELNPVWLSPSRGRGSGALTHSYFGHFPLLNGGNFGVRSTIWQTVGALKEDFSPHGVLADQEFAMRCWLQGVQVVYHPEVVVHYRYRTSGRSLWKQGFTYGFQRPGLARKFHEATGTRLPRFAGWKTWFKVVLLTPSIVRQRHRPTWSWMAGHQLGLAAGSVRHRFLFV